MSRPAFLRPLYNEICSRQNRPSKLGRTLRHMAETAVIFMAGGWTLQIGIRPRHLRLWSWWRALKKASTESSTQSSFLSVLPEIVPVHHWAFVSAIIKTIRSDQTVTVYINKKNNHTGLATLSQLLGQSDPDGILLGLLHTLSQVPLRNDITRGEWLFS